MKKSNNNNKEAKFFCESCGSEVPKNARTCPTCGKFFASVRCPKCNTTGSTEDFLDGCPSCGYAVHSSTYGGYGFKTPGSKNSAKTKRNKSFSLFENKNKGDSSPIPFWIYLVCIVILIILIIMLYSCIRK